MRVLMCHRPGGAFGYITDGMINAMRDRGHTVQRWDGNHNSWHSFQPDCYIGCSGHKQPIPPNRRCKVAIHVNPYGPVDLGGINESQDNIRWTISQKPDAVFGYGIEEDRLLWSYWTDRCNIKWVPMPTAGDKCVFKQITSLTDRQFDVVYLGGRWSYKALTIDRYLIPMLKDPNIRYKLHGWGDWPSGINSGQLADDKANEFLNSGKIGPCIVEQHTTEYGIDIPERAFKVALCGMLIVHDSAMSVNKLIPSAIIATTPEDFKDLCIYYSRDENQDKRIDLIKKQQQEVLSNNTYHHRIATLFNAIGFEHEAKAML